MAAASSLRRPGARAAILAALIAACAGPGRAQPAAPDAVASKPAPRLARIVLVPQITDVAPAGAPADGPPVDAARVPALAEPAAQGALQPFIGRSLDSALIAGVRGAVSGYYAKLGRPFVSTTIPQQDVTNGVLQIVVIEARVGKVTVEGAHWFRPGQYLDELHLAPGGPIDQPRMQADLDWINRNPYRRATVVAQAGATEGITDLVVHADERRPWAVNAGFDNTGTKSTGLSRVNLGFDWGDAFGRGDGLNYQFTGGPDSTSVRQHNLSYTTDLPWRHTLNLTLAYGKTRSIDASDFNSTGISKTALVRYAIPLKARGRWVQHVGLGYDFKSTDNDILFGGESVFPTVSEIDQFTVEYVAQGADRAGSTSVTLSLVGSPGGITAHNDDADFDAQLAGAKARYGYLRAAVSRTTNLSPKLTWSSRAVGQLAGGTLLPSEQIAFGGVSSVRGMIEQATTRDHGLYWQNELRPASIALGPKAAGISLSPFWFLDGGVGANHHEAEGAPSSWMALVTTGPGLNLQLSRHAGLRLTLGEVVLRKGSTGGRLEAQFGIQASF